MAPTAPAATYALLFVVAFHHYDVLYRVLHGAEVPEWLRLAGLGLDGRLLLLAGVAGLTPGRLDTAVAGLAAWCAVVFGLLGTASHLREGLRRPPAPASP